MSVDVLGVCHEPRKSLWSFADHGNARPLLLNPPCLAGLHNSLQEQVLQSRLCNDFCGKPGQPRPRDGLDGPDPPQLMMPESALCRHLLASARRLVQLVEYFFALALA